MKRSPHIFFDGPEYSLRRAFWQRQFDEAQGAFLLAPALLCEQPAAQGLPPSIVASLHESAHETVNRLSKQSDIGILAVIAAALALVLGRLTDKQRVVMELPSNGDLPESERPLLVVPMYPQQTIKDLLLQLTRSIPACHDNQNFPVHEFAQALGIDAGSDVLLASEAVHRNVTVASHHVLSVQILRGATIGLRLSSPSRRVPMWFLTELGEQLSEVLASFVNLGQPLTSVQDVIHRRVMRQLSVFNATEVDFPAGWLAKAEPSGDRRRATVIDLFERQVVERPDAIALICGDVTLSYLALDEQAEHLASHLATRFSIGRDSIVASLSTRSHWAIIALLAILKTGATFLPLNPKMPPQGMLGILSESGASVLVAHSSYLELVMGAAEIPLYAIDLQLFNSAPVDRLPSRCSVADLAYIIYTSGTTGVPKGVMIPHGGLTNTVLEHIEHFDVTPVDRYLQFMAMSFDGFLLDTFTTLCAGAALLIADEQTIENPACFVDYLERYGATISTITPSYLQLLDPDRVGRLRILVSAGETLNPALARRYAERLALYNGYGPSEATINSTLYRVDPSSDCKLIPIGRPGANKQIFVVGEQLQLQTVGVVGELCVAGEGLARGYLADPDATEQKFVECPFSEGGRMYRTGDFGAWTPEGTLLFKGRADSQTKVNGLRIDLNEIELSLQSCTDLRASHLLAHQSRTGCTEILAFYQRAHGLHASLLSGDCTSATMDKTTATTLRSHLQVRLPAYMVPHRFVEVKEWPLTPHGKIDRQVLLSLAAEVVNRDTSHVPPTNAMESSLCRIWSEVLDLRKVGVEDNFFSLGCDSIRVIQAVHKARQEGIPVDAADVMTYQTVKSLVACIEARAPQKVAVLLHGDTSSSGLVPLHLAALTDEEAAALPAGTHDAYPASAMQLLMLDAYKEDRYLDGIYHCCAVWHIEDPTPSEDALVAALRHLYNTQRSLRTTFLTAPSGRRLQVVRVPERLAIHRVDLRNTGTVADEGFFQQQIAADIVRRFDPEATADPLVRFKVWRTSDTACALLFSFHHAILDGWSGVELRNTLAEHYTAFKQDRQPPVQEAQHDSRKEFVALELAASGDSNARHYWESRLANVEFRRSLQPSYLLEDCRSSTSEAGFATFTVQLSAATLQAADETAKRLGVTLKAVFLDVVTQSLMDVLDISELAMGVVVNGRSEWLSDPLRSTGLFWNILPIAAGVFGNSMPQAMQAQLNEIELVGSFPLREMERQLGGPLLVPSFNFVNFHNARTSADVDLHEVLVNDRFHFPLNIFVAVVKTIGETSGVWRVQFDRSRFNQTQIESVIGLCNQKIFRQFEKEKFQ